MDEQLVALYHRHVAAAYDRQMRLADLIEREAPGADWGYNVPTAALTFGSTLRFEAHLLGTLAADDSWLWAWNNPGANLPAGNAQLAEAVRGLALTTHLNVFSTDGFINGQRLVGPDFWVGADHIFGVIVGGELGYNAYYTMPYETGRALGVIRDDRLRCDEPHPLLRISDIFPRMLSDYTVLDHRAAFLGYLDWYSYTPETEERAVRIIEDGNEIMRAEFDDLNRLTNLTGRLQGHQ